MFVIFGYKVSCNNHFVVVVQNWCSSSLNTRSKRPRLQWTCRSVDVWPTAGRHLCLCCYTILLGLLLTGSQETHNTWPTWFMSCSVLVYVIMYSMKAYSMPLCSYSWFPVLDAELLEPLEGQGPPSANMVSRHSSPASPTAIFRRSKQVRCISSILIGDTRHSFTKLFLLVVLLWLH